VQETSAWVIDCQALGSLRVALGSLRVALGSLLWTMFWAVRNLPGCFLWRSPQVVRAVERLGTVHAAAPGRERGTEAALQRTPPAPASLWVMCCACGE